MRRELIKNYRPGDLKMKKMYPGIWHTGERIIKDYENSE